jgi:hypothetical protein
MPAYKAAIATVAAATAAPYATFQTAAGRRAWVNALSMTTRTATASSCGVLAPNNTPVSTGPVTGVANDDADASPALSALAATWSTPPTIPGSPVYRIEFDLGPAIGAGFAFRWPRDDQRITLAKNSGSSGWLVFWNYGGATASVCSLSVEFDE